MYLPPWVLQIFGMAIIAFAAIIWWQTGQESLLIMSAGMSLAAVGAVAGGVKITVKQDKDKKERDKSEEKDES